MEGTSLGGKLVLVSTCLTVSPLITGGQAHTHTHIQVDCQIQTKAPKQNAAGFGQLLILSKTISIAKLGTSSIASRMMACSNFNKVSNNNALSFFNYGCLHRLIVNSVSEGSQQVAPN
jgi:hypothetical protein